MKDETSLLAIDDDTQEIVGVLVGKPMIRENWSWNFFRMLLPTNYVSQIIGNFERDMVMAHVPNAEHRDPPSSYHVFAICLSPAYKGRNQKPRFLIDAYKVARSLGLPKLSFIGKSLNDQIRASRIGMTVKKILILYLNLLAIERLFTLRK
ncbi:unnamed protein product [Hermetia illucens]|uniref:N-acetyltransferase domain-containing protein n=1 Tax=Hermetia illucens TaxID=343691 RepID=A0A7R8UVQ0_HERIL|nr:unnamed protein product [Hermetia illucens]